MLTQTLLYLGLLILPMNAHCLVFTAVQSASTYMRVGVFSDSAARFRFGARGFVLRVHDKLRRKVKVAAVGG